MTTTPNEEVIARITTAIALADDLLFELTGPVTTAVMMKPNPAAHEKGGYKQKPFTGAEELTFAGVRDGKTGIIFEFDPVDDRPFDRVEFKEKQAFAAVKGLEDRVVKMLGYPGGTEEQRFSDAVKRIRKDAEARAEAAAVAAKAEADDAYADNPMFGMF